MAELRATPYANPLTGLSNDVIQGLLGYMKDKKRTQQLQGLAGLLESTGIPKTVERAAYAESPTGLLNALTNVNRANVPLLKPETADALMTLAPVPSGANKAAMAAGRVGERYAEKVVPQILERGGLPAGLLQDLAQGSRSQIIKTPETGLLNQQLNLPKDYYELNSLATQAYSDLRKAPSQEAADYYKSIIKARDEAANNPSNNYTPPVADVVEESYKGQHAAPTKDSGAPLWNLKDTYPDDFYSSNGARYYGDGADEARDRMIVSQMQSMKNRPDKMVTIYRAVPKDVETKKALNVGDWVTLDRQYAKEHGEGALNGEYKIVKKSVKARDLFTNGDSIYEMGYDPQPFISKRDLGLLE